MRAWLSIVAAITVVCLPQLVLACPYCAAAGEDGGNSFYWILGAMIVLPFPIFGLVTYIIRRGDEGSHLG